MLAATGRSMLNACTERPMGFRVTGNRFLLACMTGIAWSAQIPYRTVEVSPLTKEQLKWSDYRKVPVAVLDGEQVVDSTAIITRLAAELHAQQAAAAQQQRPAKRTSWLPTFGHREQQVRHTLCAAHFELHMQHACGCCGRHLLVMKVYGSSLHVRGMHARRVQADAAEEAEAGARRADEERWRRWVDERLVRLLTVNIYRSAHEAFQTFDYIAGTGFRASSMYPVSKIEQKDAALTMRHVSPCLTGWAVQEALWEVAYVVNKASDMEAMLGRHGQVQSR